MIEGVVQFTGPIGPTASGDTFPTHIDFYGKGGLRNVANVTDRNNIPYLRRDIGMVVGIPSDNLYWKLATNPTGDTTTNGDWEVFNDVYVSGGTYDAVTGVVTFTNNSGGTFNVSGFVTGMTDTYTTGASLNNGVIFFNRTDAASAYSVSLSAYSSGISADTYWTSGSTWNGTNYPIRVKNSSATDATGDFAVAEGADTLAAGQASHAEGASTIAYGNYSHAEGQFTIASGSSSHVEGTRTTAEGSDSHAEGEGTWAFGNQSHTEGGSTKALGQAAHAEGGVTTAVGFASHAEGSRTIASGDTSHAGGSGTTAMTFASFAIGVNSIASASEYVDVPVPITIISAITITTNDPIYSGVSGYAIVLSGDVSSEWWGYLSVYCTEFLLDDGAGTTQLMNSGCTIFTCYYDVGTDSTYIIDSIISATTYTLISGSSFYNAPTLFERPAFALGTEVQALGINSHAEGYSTISSGQSSHAEGFMTTAGGDSSHAEGNYTTAIGKMATHAEGDFTTAFGAASHAEGANTIS